MDPQALRVVADDLTGACDIAAALLPWEDGVVVHVDASATDAQAGLEVVNTQSRTLGVEEARVAVRRAVGSASRPDTLLLKKIDTALRGHLGAELDAAMAALGAEEAFVAPAIPAVGRTTVNGVQHIDGVPVHQTAFAADPLHPIADSAVARHVERDSMRRCHLLPLACVRSPERLAAAIDAGRHAGSTTFVCDAERDADLDLALGVLLERPRPVVLAGSLALGQAVRRRLAVPHRPPPARAARRARQGALVVVGSAHPTARLQSEGLGATFDLSDREPAAATGARAGAALAAQGLAVLRTPARVEAGAAATLLEGMAQAVVACVRERRPGALVLVGGETAHVVLRALGQGRIRVVAGLAPLVVGGELVGGGLAETPLVTKAGSAGDAETLVRALAWTREVAR
jgi:uncharacterized protein YgbK (DUF1537 family)